MIMQNKPNFQNVQMVVTAVYTMNYNNEQRTMNYAKQTQSNPTCSELVEPISKGTLAQYNNPKGINRL